MIIFATIFVGGLAAGLTTPLDVAKTRIMLAEVKTGNSCVQISHLAMSKLIFVTSDIIGVYYCFRLYF